MAVFVGVRFRGAGKLYQFESGNLALERLDKVVVETAHGLGVGRVVTEPQERDHKDLPHPVRRVVRKATGEDIERERHAREQEELAVERARECAREHRLNVHIVGADANLDGSRLTITYSTEARVDVRAVAKQLATELGCRVDMHQVGARDEAKALDGIGPCGQRLCCSRWMTEFKPVSIKMAKLQGLALNPGKLAGVCGRLKCCLRFEIENYEGQRDLPALGSIVYTTDGEGRVVAVNVPDRKVSVLGDDPSPRWVPADEVFSHNGCGSGQCSCGRS